MMLDRSFWNRSSGMTPELSDSISFQPFDNFFHRIKAFTNAGEKPGAVFDLNRLSVCLQKQLCCGVGCPSVPAVEGVPLRQPNQETGGLCECVAVERPHLSNYCVQLRPACDPVRVSFSGPGLLQNSIVHFDQLWRAEVLEFDQPDARDPDSLSFLCAHRNSKESGGRPLLAVHRVRCASAERLP